MFGEKLDYLILRTLAHRRNIATEEQLDVRASEPVSNEIVASGAANIKKYVTRFEGMFPLNPDLSYLDIGCGTGEVTIALSKLGCGHVTGIDYMARNITQSNIVAAREGMSEKVEFVCQDIYQWTPARKFDVLISFNALEHIENPRLFLEAMTNLISKGGVAVLAFGPLFHSPFGDHMWGFFKLQIPWRGLLFSEKAVLRLRREYFRPTDPAVRYQNIVGGLNLMRFSEFLSYVQETGWNIRYLAVNPFLKRFGVLYGISNLLVRSNYFRNYFAGTVYAILDRPANVS